jgi:hypothetical protein
MRTLRPLLMVASLAVLVFHGIAVVGLLLPLLAGLLAIQFDPESGRVARGLVRAAVRLLPVPERDRFLDQWMDHVDSGGEQGLSPLTRGLSIALIGGPALAVGLRVGRARRRSQP